MSSSRITRYWADRLQVRPSQLDRPGVHVVGWSLHEQVQLLLRGRTCLISVGEHLVETVRARAARLDASAAFESVALTALFPTSTFRMAGPLYQGYVEHAHFRPVSSDEVRPIHPHDVDKLANLQAACDPLAWAHSGVRPDKANQFGLYRGGEIVAIGHYDLWAPYAASIGVLTHPAIRGQGYGKMVASAAMEDAFSRNLLVIYQTMLDNVPSLALARALGCRTYATTLRLFLCEENQ